MDTTWNPKTAVRAKVAFLAIFVAALISARLIVAMRSVVALSEPIPLAHAGLSVCMPQGNGWNSAQKWEYKQDVFTLFGVFAPGSSRPTASARCDYVFPSEVIDLEERFELRRRETGGEIVEKGQIRAGSVVIDWVRIYQAEVSASYMIGTGELPYNRRINIEVYETTADLDMARGVFNAIAKSIDITDSPLIEAAGAAIAQMKDKGLASYLDNKNRQGLFLIRDSRRRIIGFTTDVLIDTGGASELNIEAMGLYYTRSPLIHEEMTSFQSDNRVDRFTWKTESVAAERSRIEIVLKEKGLLTITKSGEPDRESSYHTGDTAVPEILLEQLVVQVIDSGIQEAVADVITSDARIVPIHISQIKPQDTTADQSEPYMIKLMPLSGRRFFQLIYLDGQKKISRIEQQSIERIEDRYYFDLASPADAAKLFPERSEFILQSDKLKQYLDEII